MPFIEKKGVNGLVWVPEQTPSEGKKHPCPDCECCNHCADSRCRVCLRRKACSHAASHARRHCGLKG